MTSVQLLPLQIIVSGTSPLAGWALSPWEPTAAQNVADEQLTAFSPSTVATVAKAASRALTE